MSKLSALLSAIGPTTDPYIQNTTLLLHGDGTQGAQNNTFADGSPNGFPLTRNGNATQGSFSPYGTRWSNAFSGTTDSFSLAGSVSSAAFTLGTGDYTIEFWICFSAVGSAEADIFESQTVNTLRILKRGSSSGLSLDYYGGTARLFIADANIKIGTWYHIAASRVSGTLRGFVDGQQVFSAPDTTNLVAPTAAYAVGARNGGTNPFSGFISNLRLVKGSAGAYTSNFVPSTSPLTAISGTTLLTCQSNRFRDASSNNFALTTAGTPRVTNFAPFAPTVPYSPTSTSSTNPESWSVTFNGSTDYLATPSSTAFAFGTNDFVMEAVVYTGSASTQRVFSCAGVDDVLFVVSGSKVYLNYYDGIADRGNSSYLLPLNQWVHVAVVRVGGTVRLFANGVLTNTPATSAANHTTAQSMFIGRYSQAASGFFNGSISNARIIVGAANIPAAYQTTATTVGTTVFAPPTSSLLPVTGTVLLTCQSADFADISSNNFAITKTGSPQIVAADPFMSPTNQWSYNWQTKTDSITFPSTASLVTFTGDFTIEAWVNPTDTSLSGAWGILDARTSGGTAANWIFSLTSYTTAGWLINFYTGGNRLSSLRVPANQWSHVAVSRQGSTIRFFVNGQLDPTTSSLSGTLSGGTSMLMLGSKDSGLASYGTVGNISNLRITNGGALYTTAFTPSTTPLTTTVPVGTVTLLTCQAYYFVDQLNNVPTPSSTMRVSAASPFTTNYVSVGPLGGSGYFDASGDFLSLTSTSTAFDIKGDFTLETWYYATAASAVQTLATIKSVSGTGYAPCEIQVNTSRIPSVNLSENGGAWATTVTSSTAIPLYQWNHIAVSRVGTAITLYLNGASVGTGTNGNALYTGGTVTAIAARASGGTLNGYLSDTRLVNGAAAYTGAFTPPTAPILASGPASAASYPSTTNVNTTFSSASCSLLVNFNNAGIYDSTAQNVLETVGTAQISTTVVRMGTGSLSFSGSGAYLRAPGVDTCTFRTGDFTVEYWIRYNALPAAGSYALAVGVSGTAAGMSFGVNGSKLVATTDTVGYGSTGATLVVNTWYHVAFARQSGTLRFFLNGVLDHTTTVTTDLTELGLNVGGESRGFNTNGYIDDIRVTKGIARYISNFQPPRAPFPDL